MFEKWVKSSFSIATIDEDSENCCIHVHVHVLHDICEEEIIFHEVSRQPCCLPICPFEKNASGQIGKWKRLCLANEKWEKYFRSPSLYLRHWSHTDLERYIYWNLAASIGLSLTKTHGYLILHKLNILHPHVNVLYCKKQLSDFHSI